MNENEKDPAARALSRLVWLPWIGVLLLVLALSVLTLRVNGSLTARRVCTDHLQAIHKALRQYDQEQGALPRLDFYPTNTKSDEDSLLVALKRYGLSPEAGLCPATPGTIREEQGLTYLWNVELNGRPLREIPANTWMLIEITALSDTIKAPHFGRYNILQADGSILESYEVPAKILGSNTTP